MSSRILVLDANILIRAVLGNKVRDFLTKYSENVIFVLLMFVWQMLKNICLFFLKKVAFT